MISSFQNALDEHPDIDIREMIAVSVTAVTSKTRKTPYIIIKDLEHRGCHSENAKICINLSKMLEITQKLVLIDATHWPTTKYPIRICLFPIFGYKMAFFCPNFARKWPKIQKKCNFFEAKFPTSLWIFTILVRNFFCGFLMVFRNKYWGQVVPGVIKSFYLLA